MAEKKEPGHRTGVQVPAQLLSSCVILDFISLSLSPLSTKWHHNSNIIKFL